MGAAARYGSAVGDRVRGRQHPPKVNGHRFHGDPDRFRLLAEFIEYRSALLLYWFNILLQGAFLLASWYRAKWSGLVDKDMPEGIDDAFVQRVVRAQTLYAIGAALCVFSTWWSIGFIVAVQLNYVIAPRFWPFDRL